MNVQLLGGDSKELHSECAGAPLVAITDANLSVPQKNGQAKELHFSRGDVQWFDGAAPTLKNLGKDPARFAVLEMK